MNPQHEAACVQALGDSVGEVASTVLGGMPVAADTDGNSSSHRHGAYPALVADGEPVQVALLADASACQLLSKTLLGMEPEDADLSDSDVSDAMCEIINIIAGGLKRRVSESIAVTMGLPLFVAGPLLPNHQQHVHGCALRLGTVRVEALLLTQRRSVEVSAKSDLNHRASQVAARE